MTLNDSEWSLVLRTLRHKIWIYQSTERIFNEDRFTLPEQKCIPLMLVCILSLTHQNDFDIVCFSFLVIALVYFLFCLPLYL